MLLQIKVLPDWPKGEQRNPSSDNEDGVDDGDLNYRITDIMIDTTIPIKAVVLDKRP